MDIVWRILREHPYLLLILIAWIVGAIGNVAKAARRSRERAEQQRRMPPILRTESPPPSPTQRSADDVAAEMRRILGMEGPVQRPRPVEAEVHVPAKPRPAPRRRDVVVSERPPTPVAPTTQARALEIHVDSHIGDGIKARHLDASPKGARARDREMGTLGGRVHAAVRRRTEGARYSLDDLKTAFVLSEILGPPMSLRGIEERLR